MEQHEQTEIRYFDTTKKLLQNIENCLNKVENPNTEIDNFFIKESLKTIISIVQTQNTLLEYLSKQEEEVDIISDESQIIKGMICYIRNKKKFGKIININESSDVYTLCLLGTNEILTVNKKHFNI